jgi:hypothetical protein
MGKRVMMRAGRRTIACPVCPENPVDAMTPTMITKDFPLI